MYTMPKMKKYQPWRPDKICVPIDRENNGYNMQAIDVKRLGYFCIEPYLND